MDFDLRQWLLVLGPLFIVGILFHGFWRMRQNRNKLKMSLDKTFLSDESDGNDDLLMFKAELPNGGARVRDIHEQTSLDLDDGVPVLMDPVDEIIQKPETRQETEQLEEPSESAGPEPVAGLSAAREANSGPDVMATSGAISVTRDGVKQSQVLDTPVGPEKFVVVSVLSTADDFSGGALLALLQEQKMIHGEMNIFHRQDSAEQSVFSLANAVEPGTFDPASMKNTSTPGISLFLRVHELSDPVQAFNDMVDVAQTLAENLGGELRDDTRSVMTSQTIAHAQQDLIEYQHKYR